MEKIVKHFLTFICLMAILALPALVLAESSATNNLKYVGETGNAPYKAITAGDNDVAGIVGSVIQAFLSLLGVIFLVYIVYAGFNWMIAQGDEEKVTKAKETITRAVVGLIITVAAYAISFWVFERLLLNTNIVT